MRKIEVGQLYKVTGDNFITTGTHHTIHRRVFIKKGEIIEIRFPYDWHFRTEDSSYFNATPETIVNNCEIVGTIYANVRFDNIASLKDILKLGLYTKAKNGAQAPEGGVQRVPPHKGGE